jgi:hypothetical protein
MRTVEIGDPEGSGRDRGRGGLMEEAEQYQYMIVEQKFHHEVWQVVDGVCKTKIAETDSPFWAKKIVAGLVALAEGDRT